MITRSLMVVGSILLAGIPIPAGADHFGEPDREATYVGFLFSDHGLNEHWVPACEMVFGLGDCPTPIPNGVISSSCDHESHLELGLYQGIGGVLFCGVPDDAVIGVAIHDDLTEPVTASVACRVIKAIGWNYIMGTIDGHGTFDLQEECPMSAQHGSDPPGTTRIVVFIHGPPRGLGATMEEVTMNVL